MVELCVDLDLLYCTVVEYKSVIFTKLLDLCISRCAIREFVPRSLFVISDAGMRGCLSDGLIPMKRSNTLLCSARKVCGQPYTVKTGSSHPDWDPEIQLSG